MAKLMQEHQDKQHGHAGDAMLKVISFGEIQEYGQGDEQDQGGMCPHANAKGCEQWQRSPDQSHEPVSPQAPALAVVVSVLPCHGRPILYFIPRWKSS
jgi:hypothetical protein